jgi:hypothetical protein
MKRFVVVAVFASLLAFAPAGADRPTNSAPNDERSDVMSGPPTAASKEREAAVGMKIRLKAGEKVLSATLIDSGTARDFASLLPLTLTMNDLFSREKFAHLPRPISEDGKRTHTYEVGDVVYWSPGPDVAILYRHDGQRIPAPGIIVIGKVDSSVEALNAAGPVKVTIELVAER